MHDARNALELLVDRKTLRERATRLDHREHTQSQRKDIQ